MPEQALQTAFEIKTACDDISRRLLRWHWEQKPGAHSLDSLLQHLEQRRTESPEYYDRLPDLAGKTGWQQLDTTLCMRVLLDPEKDATRPLDLLGNTAHPSAARHACNAVRTARNEAAHAADDTDAAQAALLFSEAIEALEDGYANSAFTEYELAQYYRKAEEFLSRFGKKAEPQAKAAPAAKPRPQKAAPTSQGKSTPAAQSAAPARRGKAADSPAAKKPRAEKATSSRKGKGGGKGKSSRGKRAQRRRKQTGNRALWVLLLVLVAVGLMIRAKTMGA